MDPRSVPQPKVSKGLSSRSVLILATVLLLACLYAVYFASSRIDFASLLPKTTPSDNSETKRIESSSTEVKEQNLQKQISKPSPAPAQSSLKTYDIGAYLTYGNKASLLNRAVAKLSSDRKRLSVGLYEETQGSKEVPALAFIIDFKSPQKNCSTNSIKELAIFFNLKSMGNIAAQKAQVVERDASDIQLALSDFACELKPGATLTLSSLGSNPNLLKPSPTTFGWGVRLSQEIGE